MYGCGFTNKAYFYREFAKRFGTTPGEYRRNA
jgi:AraC-like DNA-binding protein